MTRPRFLVPDLPAAPGECALPLDEAHHLTRVLRLGTGAEIVVFDGRGQAFLARVVSAAKDAVRVELIEPVTAASEPRVLITLAQGVLKGEKMDHVVRDATMMGVAAIVPLVTSRTVVPARGARASVERWSRVAVASAKQCGRAVVPAIADPIDVETWLRSERPGVTLVLVEPSAASSSAADPLRQIPTPPSATVLAGPEGGWAREELETLLAAGCLPLTLGARTLRADAVPVPALAVLNYVWGDE